MKKISFFALALCAACTTFAQTNQPQLRTPMAVKTRIGLRGGVNLADLTAKNLPSGATFSEAQAKTSFVAGAFANIPLAGMLRFQPEVAFSSQGGKVQGKSSNISTVFEQDLHYINVPLNFQLMTSKGFFVQTGPQLGYLVDASIKNSTNTSVTANRNNKEQFDKLDFSWTGGVGYLSRIGLGIDLRYNIGIANIVSDDASGGNTLGGYKGGTWKNSVGQFSLIYQFGAYK